MKLKSFLIVSVILVITIFAIVRIFIFSYDEIVGDTMREMPNGGSRLVCKICRDIKRGDIVEYSPSDNQELISIGRIIGLPNETITVESNHLKVNGNELKDDYADWSGWKNDTKLTVKLNDKEFFTLTDKRVSPLNPDLFTTSRKFTMSTFLGKFL